MHDILLILYWDVEIAREPIAKSGGLQTFQTWPVVKTDVIPAFRKNEYAVGPAMGGPYKNGGYAELHHKHSQFWVDFYANLRKDSDYNGNAKCIPDRI